MSTKIAFIGAGIATSYTLIPFLEALDNDASKEKITLYIIDKSADFFKGMPYGERSGKSVLLIQDLKNFISEPHRTHYKNWLNENIDELAQEFLANGGRYAAKWVADNSPLYKNGDWDDLYVPRFFFGRYIHREVVKRVDKLVAEERLTLEYLQKETKSVTKEGGTFTLTFDDNSHLTVEKVVLSIGSLPYKKLYNKETKETINKLYIDAPYGEGMEENMARIASFIKARENKHLPTKIAVLGANASGLEMLYKICDKLPMEEYKTTFKTLSSHGVMPDGTFDPIRAKEFKAKHLESLATSDSLTAKLIAEAAHKDIDIAEEQALGAATTVGIISKGFGSLLPKLSKEELLNFACFHGNQIGRRQRCAGNHYLSVVDNLMKENRFTHIKGRFVRIEENTDGLILHYKPTEAASRSEESSEPFNLIVNCLGSVNLTSEGLTPFLKNLISDKLCTPNASNIGFQVDDRMQASENLFVAGPLLAGNQIEDRIFWHLEHCVRIIWSSSVLSKNLMSSLN
ncbi:FAD/NAD(P)-binding protein [Maribacter chungangensis]|uniref:FAD/NAD(P)-binding protein n=1 Tax=Maribacter chungangensis TaxID=1069117 RepID=A0ABW3B6K5_9FLAO